MNLRSYVRRLRDQPWVIRPLTLCLKAARAMGMLRGKRYYQHLPYRGMVTINLPQGGMFQFKSYGDAIENGLYWDGILSHEPESMRVWLNEANGARTVLDIGANSGLFALAACAASAASVHAFEPMPRVFRILEENKRQNRFDGLNVWPFAVGDEQGVAKLYDPGGDAPTSATLSSEFAQNHFGNIPGENVKVIDIDAFCRLHDIENVDLIKLDVEGHEEHALRGMIETVRRWKPVILVEVLDEYEGRLRSLVNSLLGETYTWKKIQEGDGGPDRNVLLSPVSRHADQ